MRRTVRVRLTALYSGLFLASSTVLLVVVNLLLRQMLDAQELPALPPPGPGARYLDARSAVSELSDRVLRFQWIVSAVVIVVLTAVSVLAGWWLAARALRPLHRITATARRLSASTLDERIALAGPRDELTELADTFDAMLDRLERSAEAQRRFVANAAHELRTPLATQRAAIQIGLDDPTPERLERARGELLDANRRLTGLLDGLLVLARGERRLTDVDTVALDEVVGEAVGGAEDVEFEVDVEPTTVGGDAQLLARLVANLVDNAVRYNRPGGRVEVRLAGGVLTVSNTGPVVPAERVDELFTPFRRLAPDRTGSAEGSGLGLSIVAAIAQAHGGDVVATPNAGGGLAVAVRLPGISPAAPAPAGAGRPAGARSLPRRG